MVGHGFLTTSIVYVRSVRARRRQLHFTHSRLEMKRERSHQLNCRKPPLAFRCVITKTAAKSKYFQIRFTRRRLNGKLIAALRQLQPEVGDFLPNDAARFASCIALPQSKERCDCQRPSQAEAIPGPVAAVRNSRGVAGRDKRSQMARGVTA